MSGADGRDTTIGALDADEATARIGELAALLCDAVAHGASVNFMAGLTAVEAEAFWHGQIAGIVAGGRTLIVAQRDGRIVGTVVLTPAPQPNAPHRAEIGKMLVHSTMRRQGHGRRLLETAEAEARRQGRTLLLLDTASGSAGEKLYRSSGWTEYGVVPNHSHVPAGGLESATFFYKELE